MRNASIAPEDQLSGESIAEELNALLDALDQEFQTHDISYCFIGGFAVREYGFVRMTVDIDVLVKKSDEPKLQKVFGIHDITRFKFRGTPIDVLFSGERIGKRGVNFPEPAAVLERREHGNFVTLKNLLVLKLDSGLMGKRLKDLGDVQELIRVNHLSRDYLNDTGIPDYIEEFRRIFELTAQGPDE